MSEVRETPERPPLTILLATDDDSLQWLQPCATGLGQLQHHRSGTAFLQALGATLIERARQPTARDNAPVVVIVGAKLADMTRLELLRALAGSAFEQPVERPVLFLADREAAGRERGRTATEELPEGTVVHYRLHPGLSREHVRLLWSSLRGLPPPAAPPTFDDPQRASQMTRVFDIVSAVASRHKLDEAATVLAGSVAGLVQAERVHCLFHDTDSGILWSELEDDGRDDELAASVGLAGFAARTGRLAHASRADADPRYHRTVDDPAGNGRESVLAQPVVGPDGEIHIVLVAIRSQKDFAEDHRSLLAAVASHVAPSVHLLALRMEAESVIEAGREDGEGLFRREAIEAYVSRGRRGDVVRVLPTWVRWAYWMLLVLLAMSAVYLVVGRVDEYSVGRAVVRVSGRSDISAHAAGKVVAVDVAPGQHVEAGDVVARLYRAAEAAELERNERDLNEQLRARMLDPGDPAARQAVSSLRAEVQRARARLEERTIRAPSGGTISAVLVQPNQHVNPGDLVASLEGPDTQPSVVALMPGADRPKLTPGMSLRLELDNYRYAYQDLVIESVSDEIIGPTEARRSLGRRIADGVGIGISGPIVVVKARLPADWFKAKGKVYRYHDGMAGFAEVRTGSRRIVVALIPQLEEL